MTHTSVQLLWHKTAAISKQLASLILCTSHMSWLNPHFCARLVLLSALTLEEQYKKSECSLHLWATVQKLTELKIVQGLWKTCPSDWSLTPFSFLHVYIVAQRQKMYTLSFLSCRILQCSEQKYTEFHSSDIRSSFHPFSAGDLDLTSPKLSQRKSIEWCWENWHSHSLTNNP